MESSVFIGQSKPILLRAAEAFEASSVDALVVVVPGDRTQEARRILDGLRKPCQVVAGGERRQDSVMQGLRLAPAGFDGVVLVHDAARPLLEPALIDAVAAAARDSGAAIPVLGLADTIKRVQDGRVVETLDRSVLFAAQTPQGFRISLLLAAYQKAEADAATVTDEAMAVERLGAPVAVVPGSARNRKLTTPEDLAWAESELAARAHPVPA